MTKEELLSIYSERVIAFHPSIARAVGGVGPGLFLCQLLYWTGKEKEGDGWVYKTQAEWEEETCLSRREQETARKHLKELGVLSEKLQGLPAKLFYRVNLEILADVIKDGGKRQTRKDGTAKQERRKRTLSIAKNTTKTTTQDAPAAAGPHKRIMDLCSYLSEQLRGEKPIIDGKEGAQLKRLLSLRTPEEIEAKAHALADKIRTGTTEYWTGASVLPSVISSRWNSLDTGRAVPHFEPLPHARGLNHEEPKRSKTNEEAF